MENYSSIVMDSLLRMNEQAQIFISKEAEISESEDNWRGLGFLLNGQRVVAAMNEITEIIDLPDLITIVPDTRTWVVGLANLQGEVLPITDLQCFVGGSPVRIDNQSKVLVIKNHGKFIGLLIPTVLGIQHLPSNKKKKYSPIENFIDLFIYEVFNIESDIWPVFSMAALVNNKRFLMAGNLNNTTEQLEHDG